MKKIYLDYNASTPLAPEVIDEMKPFLTDFYGNPSALHWAGKPVKEKLTFARKQVADLLLCSPDEVIFTSGGSEANNLALKGYYFKNKEKGIHIITSTIEHPAIVEPLNFLKRLGAEITRVGVNEHGMVSPIEIEKAIREDTILITIMHSNNEVGTIQPIEEIGKIAKKHGIAFHIDASQSAGKIPIDIDQLNADMLTIAGHKLYAPKGIGALYLRKGIEVEPLIHGAGHEFGLRAGTENTLLAAGLGKACALALESVYDSRLEELTNYFWGQLKEAFGNSIVLNGHEEKRLPNTLNVSFVNRVGQDILSSIPMLAASTGSACHAGKVELSPVLREMGVPESIGMGAIRFSLGRFTIKEELDQVVFWLKEQV
ncbi:cysteine desulfurase family protein [Cytobacillus sp. NCCP-133]|uniref:cysteine desulfurase family protein n=1 Tax=Cytobacillus sp. NCCP-133 TaxID=766848 RepID=UPI002232ACDC|nr:cysteine desulfurase family protein [Cytobacillus sp. NCCP-133]GLB60135.1 cysteine desulfurase [Cytobacillus sp. NCCP-133]